MSEKKICFLAQFPPPVHGLSKAVETLYNSSVSDDYGLIKIDLKNNRNIIGNLFKILTSKADLYYFTISQTKGGNLRDLLILKILELQSKKCLLHLHGGFYRTLVDEHMSLWQRKLNYKAINNTGGVIVLSESLKSIFTGMIDEKKIFVVPNCVDNSFLMNDAEFDEKLASVGKEKVRHVLYLSNFIREKGYREVLELAKMEKQNEASDKQRKMHFHFAGQFFDKEERDYFEKFVVDNCLEDVVTYHGVVCGDSKLKLLKQCDVFILLTRYPKEGQPISILEAMGNGLAIITTDHAGIPDVVRNGENGIVLKIDEPVEALLDLMDNIDLKTIAVANRKSVLDNYQEHMYIDNMKACFERILSD